MEATTTFPTITAGPCRTVEVPAVRHIRRPMREGAAALALSTAILIAVAAGLLAGGGTPATADPFIQAGPLAAPSTAPMPQPAPDAAW